MKSPAFFALILSLSPWVAPSLQAASAVIISEFMAANGTTLADDDGEYSDWIELSNLSSAPVNLLNWSLTDSPGSLTKWRFPATNLPPGGFLVVFASEKDRRVPGAPLHTNFKLSAGGEFLALVEPDGVTVASRFAPTYPPQVPDVSFGFGAEVVSRTLVATGAVGRVLVPSDGALGLAWTTRLFDDAGWGRATNGIGFETGEAEFNAGAAAAAIAGHSPLLHLRLSEAAGATAANDGSLGPAANGAVLNGVTLNQAGARPPAFTGFETDNFAMRFDGVDDKIDVPSNAALNPAAFTVEVWARVNGGAGTYRCPVASRDDFPQRGYLFYAGDNNLWQFWTGVSGGGWQSMGSPSNVVVGEWTHLVGTYDGTTKNFYVNGALVGSAATVLAPNTARPLRVGAGATEGAGQFFFNGDVDEVAVFGRALSGAEVTGHYLAARTGAGSPVGGPPTNFNFTASIQTDLRAAMAGVNASAYARFPFVIENPATVGRLLLRMKYDDGFVALINGQPAASANAPAEDALAWNSAATSRRPGLDALNPVEFDLTGVRDALVAGTNILAVQGLNFGATNVDFLAVPELVALGTGGLSAEPRYFTTPTPGSLNGAGAADLGPILSGVHFTPELPVRPRDGDDLNVVARVQPSFSPLSSVTLRYRVMYGATNSVPMVDDGLHGDGAAGDGVYGAAIPAAASGPGQMVRFQVWALDGAGRTARWPLFDDPLGSPEYLGTVVADPAAINTLPVYEWFTDNVPASTTRTGTRASVFFNGEFFDNVFVRVRGSATTTGQKFDFNRGEHVKMNDAVGRVEEVNLNGAGSDATLLRPPLAFETFRLTGSLAGHAFHVVMRRNGGPDRVAVYVEQPDDQYLEARGLDPQGALYKFDQRANLNPVFSDSTDGVQKRTRRDEDNSDLQAFVDGLNLASPGQRMAYFFDHANVPNLINYLAVRAINMDSDDVRKNFYMYRDTRGNGEWMILPWDKDWTYGIEGDGGTFLHHPFFGDRSHAKQNANQYSVLWTVMFGDAPTREMYLRRLRTLMDQYLQPPGTAPADGWFERRVDQWSASVSNALPGTAAAVASLRSWFATRRTDLFVTYAATNATQVATNRLIPGPQPINVAVSIATIEANPSSGNQAEEYLCLTNRLPVAVDISDWRLEGAVQFRFAAGTVVRSNDVIYVSPDVNAFRARVAGPRGGLGLFVQGNYQGQLSARGEELRLVDAYGNVRQTVSTPSAPSLAQQYLRITEIQYHPAALAGNTNGPEEYEFVELRNTSPGVTLDLAGVRFVNGVLFDFTGSAVTSLAPGARVVVVRNLAAFTARYGAVAGVAGQYEGSLDNGGERLRLVDARGEEILDFRYEAWFRMTDGLGFSLVVPEEHQGAPPEAWNDPATWLPSPAVDGTPGLPDGFWSLWPQVRVNEVLTRSDVPPPTDSIELYNAGDTPADISGWFLTDDFKTPRKFRIPNGTVLPPGAYRVFSEADFNPPCPGPDCTGGEFALGSDGDEVWLFAADAAGRLQGYYDGFSFGAADDGVTFGRHVLSTGEENVTALLARTLGSANSGPRVGPVVINEIQYHPPDGADGADNAADEFLELRNLTDRAVELFDVAQPTNTWRVRGAVEFDFPAGRTLGAGEYLLLVNFDPADGLRLTDFLSRRGVPPGVAVLGPYRGKLDNSADDVELKKPATPLPTGVPHVVVDRVSYHDSAPWPAGADGTGLSLQRRAGSVFGDDPASWVAARATAGRDNVVAGVPPVITAHSGDQTVVAFSTATLSVSAQGDGPLTYQWRRNGSLLAGATNSILVLPNIQPQQNGAYSCVVANAAGSAVSADAVLSLIYGAAILEQPQGVSLRGSTNAADYGSTTNRSATFAVVASSSSPISYQWRFNGAPIPGAISSTLTVNNVTFADDGAYDVVVTDAIGSLPSNPARLSVLLNPMFLQTPVNPTVVAGGNVTFSVAISGNPPPFRYEWRRGSTPVALLPTAAERVNVVTLNTTAAGFVLAAGMASTNYTCRLIVTNAALSAPGINSQFTVTVLADSDGDGLADAWEQTYFGDATSGARNGDPDGDGMVNWQEQAAGTNPTNGASYLKIDSLAGSGPATLMFGAVAGRAYALEMVDGLVPGGWSTLAALPARTTNWIATVVDPASGTNRFYRVLTP